MPVCPYCSNGQVSDGFARCYSCGGAGWRGDSPCTACGGNGQGAPQTRQCSQCGGRGYLPDSATTAPARGNRKSTKRGSAAQPQAVAVQPQKWGLMNYLFFGLTYLFVLGYMTEQSDAEGLVLYGVPLIPALMVGAWWKFLFVMTLVVGGLYLWGVSQG